MGSTAPMLWLNHNISYISFRFRMDMDRLLEFLVFLFCILLAEKGKKLPFDIQGLRTLFYENSISGKNDIVRNLRKYLKAILNIK